MEKVASLAKLPADRGLQVEVAGKKILLVRDGETVRAYSGECPHAGAPLAEGAICNGRIICPWHKGAFRVADGALLEPPALAGLDRFPVRVDGDDIYVGDQPEPKPKTALTNDERTFVIVGAGAAGAAAAAALREFGFGGRALMIGREPTPPYDRTVLSKFTVAGEMKPEETPPLLPEDLYKEQRIKRIVAEVKRFDAVQREIELDDGRRIAFDQALLATGGEPKRLAIAGADKQGVHLLRSVRDAEAILADVRSGARAVVLGSSFIGLELASCLRAQKVDVTVASPEEIPFARQFGEKIGGSLRALHEANGVTFLAKTKAAKLEGDGRVSAVQLEDGRRLEADLVIVGVGVQPATHFISGVQTNKDGGLVADANLRVADGVYAAGDIVAFPLGGKPIRVEHWRVAQQHARIAAANMLGGSESFEGAPFFWTYHYGTNFDYLGHAESWDDEVIVGDMEGRDFAAFLLQGDRVVAVVACNRRRLTADLAERMRTPLSRDDALRLAEALS